MLGLLSTPPFGLKKTDYMGMKGLFLKHKNSSVLVVESTGNVDSVKTQVETFLKSKDSLKSRYLLKVSESGVTEIKGIKNKANE